MIVVPALMSGRPHPAPDNARRLDQVTAHATTERNNAVIKTRLMSAATVLATSALLLSGLSAPATAPDAFVCTTGQFCTWDSPEGTGRPAFHMREGANNLADVKVDGGGNYNDRISSVHNLSGKVFCLYEHLSGKGRSLAISKGYRSAIPAKYNFNNITTSVGPADGSGKCDGTVPGEG